MSMPEGERVDVLIGIGSNECPERFVPRAVRLLRERFGDVRTSTFYRTRPLGGREQPDYVNGVAAVRSVLSPAAVRHQLRDIEAGCARRRDPEDRFASRTLDLDLLLYGSLSSPADDLPAADLLERDFCLLPAAELLPDWVHPGAGRTLRQLARVLFPKPTHILGPAPWPITGPEPP
ncbi:MAG: 2-amino-4-hydroxy-6-hydroxymethyldihydropteridine diphosphokinase [Lentisphaeria bacterium]|nr:2-amino-4-hydroxy-6-hydroxymethyldihydropteridine diphosphokinase [Lentisphaeria bacterium]